MKRWFCLIASFAVLMAGTAFAKESAVQKKAKDCFVEITMEKDPPVIGMNRVEIVVTDENGRAVRDAKVVVIAFMPAMPGKSSVRNMAAAKWEGGKYRAKIDLPVGGSWEMSVAVTQGGKTTMAEWTVNTW
jgi:hypothetical protein